MKSMYKYLIIVLALSVGVGFACRKTDGYNSPSSTDKTKPDTVHNVRVANFSGGAYITYDLPNSGNILYVQAVYKINDVLTRQTKSSYYSDSVTVSGFAKSQDYQVTLYVVTRAEVMSDPVTVVVHPDTPAYLLAKPTIKMKNDFGGVNITVLNKSKSDIGIITISPDATTKRLEIINQNYTNSDSVSFSLRGYDTIPRQFGVYITDDWGNISDTLLTTITPLYEVPANKSLFAQYTLASDVGTSFGWTMNYLWDGNIGSPGYHSTYPTTALLPQWMTFDMGEALKLSRYTIWDRGIDNGVDYMWYSGAPATWVLWGRADQPVDEHLPDTTGLPDVGQATPGGWINLGKYNLPAQPSGLVNPQYTDNDLAVWNAGFSFDFSLALPKVRYIRFECITDAGGSNDFFNIMEMSFWGDPR